MAYKEKRQKLPHRQLPEAARIFDSRRKQQLDEYRKYPGASHASRRDFIDDFEAEDYEVSVTSSDGGDFEDAARLHLLEQLRRAEAEYALNLRQTQRSERRLRKLRNEFVESARRRVQNRRGGLYKADRGSLLGEERELMNSRTRRRRPRMPLREESPDSSRYYNEHKLDAVPAGTSSVLDWAEAEMNARGARKRAPIPYSRKGRMHDRLNFDDERHGEERRRYARGYESPTESTTCFGYSGNKLDVSKLVGSKRPGPPVRPQRPRVNGFDSEGDLGHEEERELSDLLDTQASRMHLESRPRGRARDRPYLAPTVPRWGTSSTRLADGKDDENDDVAVSELEKHLTDLERIVRQGKQALAAKGIAVYSSDDEQREPESGASHSERARVHLRREFAPTIREDQTAPARQRPKRTPLSRSSLPNEHDVPCEVGDKDVDLDARAEQLAFFHDLEDQLDDLRAIQERVERLRKLVTSNELLSRQLAASRDALPDNAQTNAYGDADADDDTDADPEDAADQGVVYRTEQETGTSHHRNSRHALPSVHEYAAAPGMPKALRVRRLRSPLAVRPEHALHSGLERVLGPAASHLLNTRDDPRLNWEYPVRSPRRRRTMFQNLVGASVRDEATSDKDSRESCTDVATAGTTRITPSDIDDLLPDHPTRGLDAAALRDHEKRLTMAATSAQHTVDTIPRAPTRRQLNLVPDTSDPPMASSHYTASNARPEARQLAKEASDSVSQHPQSAEQDLEALRALQTEKEVLENRIHEHRANLSELVRLFGDLQHTREAVVQDMRDDEQRQPQPESVVDRAQSHRSSVAAISTLLLERSSGESLHAAAAPGSGNIAYNQPPTHADAPDSASNAPVIQVLQSSTPSNPPRDSDSQARPSLESQPHDEDALFDDRADIQDHPPVNDVEEEYDDLQEDGYVTDKEMDTPRPSDHLHDSVIDLDDDEMSDDEQNDEEEDGGRTDEADAVDDGAWEDARESSSSSLSLPHELSSGRASSAEPPVQQEGMNPTTRVYSGGDGKGSPTTPQAAAGDGSHGADGALREDQLSSVGVNEGIVRRLRTLLDLVLSTGRSLGRSPSPPSPTAPDGWADSLAPWSTSEHPSLPTWVSSPRTFTLDDVNRLADLVLAMVCNRPLQGTVSSEYVAMAIRDAISKYHGHDVATTSDQLCRDVTDILYDDMLLARRLDHAQRSYPDPSAVREKNVNISGGGGKGTGMRSRMSAENSQNVPSNIDRSQVYRVGTRSSLSPSKAPKALAPTLPPKRTVIDSQSTELHGNSEQPPLYVAQAIGTTEVLEVRPVHDQVVLTDPTVRILAADLLADDRVRDEADGDVLAAHEEQEPEPAATSAFTDGPGIDVLETASPHDDIEGQPPALHSTVAQSSAPGDDVVSALAKPPSPSENQFAGGGDLAKLIALSTAIERGIAEGLTPDDLPVCTCDGDTDGSLVHPAGPRKGLCATCINRKYLSEQALVENAFLESLPSPGAELAGDPDGDLRPSMHPVIGEPVNTVPHLEHSDTERSLVLEPPPPPSGLLCEAQPPASIEVVSRDMDIDTKDAAVKIPSWADPERFVIANTISRLISAKFAERCL